MTSESPVVSYRRKRLQNWIDRHYGGVQSAFIAATGVNQGELSGLLRSKSFGEKRARRLEQQARMPNGYLDLFSATDDAVKPISSFDATTAHHVTNQRQRVQVRGTAAMDEQGFWDETRSDGQVHYVEWAATDGAYAIQVDSDALDPVIKRGTIVVFDPLPPAAGEYVHVQFVDGRQAMLEYMFTADDRWVFQTIKDRRRMTFEKATVASVGSYAAQLAARKRITE